MEAKKNDDGLLWRIYAVMEQEIECWRLRLEQGRNGIMPRSFNAMSVLVFLAAPSRLLTIV